MIEGLPAYWSANEPEKHLILATYEALCLEDDVENADNEDACDEDCPLCGPTQDMTHNPVTGRPMHFSF